MKRERTLYSQAIRRGWLQRTIRVSGDVEVLIEYDARGFGVDGTALPCIRMNGKEVMATLYGELSRRHWFLLPAIRRVPTSVLDVEFTKVGLYQLRYFRLALDSKVVYEEDRGTVVTVLLPPPLPIPSRTPPPDPAALPIASRPGPDDA